MRNRIVGLSVLAAVLAIALFGVPLALVVAKYFFDDERSDLERAAEVAAITLAADVDNGEGLTRLPGSGTDVTLTVYEADGRRVAGSGPATPDSVTRTALVGEVGRGNDGMALVSAVPVLDGVETVGAVRATSPRTAVMVRIGVVYLLMSGLAVVAIGSAWLISRRQARRLARPLEQMARSARALGDGDFSVRSPRAGVAEIDAVGAALDATAARLGDLLSRERAFTANASHQLRTPLTGLRLGLETALERPGQDLRAAVVAAIAGTDRLHHTIDDLLALTRGHGRTLEPLRLDDLLREVSLEWQQRLGAARRRLRVHVPTGLPALAASNAAVRQVLTVLVDNAVRHGAGTVGVVVRRTGDAVAVDVSDEGGGIAVDPDQLFAARAPRPGGHGIGLPLARDLSEADGGRLVLTRAAPPTFTLLLRVPGDRDRPAAPRAADRPEVPG
jgi:signal transduction histidine kinase